MRRHSPHLFLMPRFIGLTCFILPDDEEVVVGGPGLENGDPPAAADPPPATDELVEVDIRGKKVKMTAEAAREFTSYSVDIGAQLRSAATPKPQHGDTPPAATEDEEEPLETQIFTNPKKALDRIRDQLRTEIGGEIRSTQAFEEFWKEFYAHPDHKDTIKRSRDHSVVVQVYRDNWSTLGELPTSAAIVKGGELVKQRIMQIVRAYAPGAKDPNGTELPGSSQPGKSNPPPPAPSGEPSSLSGLLDQRRKARRAAKTKVGA